MATPVESNTASKDPRGFSGLDESQLEKSILRRGLATAAEIEACKVAAHPDGRQGEGRTRLQEPAGDHGRGQGAHPQPDGPPPPGVRRGYQESSRSPATR